MKHWLSSVFIVLLFTVSTQCSSPPKNKLEGTWKYTTTDTEGGTQSKQFLFTANRFELEGSNGNTQKGSYTADQTYNNRWDVVMRFEEGSATGKNIVKQVILDSANNQLYIDLEGPYSKVKE